MWDIFGHEESEQLDLPFCFQKIKGDKRLPLDKVS